MLLIKVNVYAVPHALTFLTFTPQIGIPRVETMSNNKKIKEFIAFECNAHIHTHRREEQKNGHTSHVYHGISYGLHVRVFDQCLRKKIRNRKIPRSPEIKEIHR